MTEASSPPIYPQYCFHLSPTIHQWCPLKAKDIKAFTSHPGFEGQNLYFHRNHPIKWVRIAGVVVAIGEYYGSRIYTVDDSSGANIECATRIPVPNPLVADSAAPTTHKAESKTNQAQPQPAKDTANISAEIDIGSVVDVKGGLQMFRNQRQIKVEKMVLLRSTDQEVSFWQKIYRFRKDVLDSPWTLDEREVRRCRKRAERDYDETREEDRKKRKEAKAKAAAPKGRTHNDMTTAIRVRKPTGLEKKTKHSKEHIHLEGNYTALGL